METPKPKIGHQTKPCTVCLTLLTTHHIYCECSSLHGVCYTCIPKCIDGRGLVRCPRDGCGARLDTEMCDGDTQSESTYMFVDHSNIRIEAQKLAAIKHHLITREDPSVRVDIRKVIDVMAEGREVVRGTLYGSRSNSIYNDWKKIKERGWKLFTTINPPGTTQKQVDQKLVADVTDLVSDKNIKKGTIIIASGDADVIPAIDKGLKKKWRFAIWAWKMSTSNSLRSIERENPESVKVVELDKFFEDVTFVKYKFNKAKFDPHLKSQTAVLTSVDFEPTERWRNELSAKLGWPFECCWIEPEENRNLMLVLGSVAAQSDDRRNAKQHFEEIFQKLKEIHGDQAKTYPEFQQQLFEKIGMMYSTSFEKPDEELINIAQTLGAPGPVPAMRGLAGRGASSCSGYASLTSNSMSYRSTPVSRTSTLSSANSFFLPISGNEESSEDGRQNPSRQFSRPCKYRARCRYGLECKFHHSEDEREFFKNPMKRTLCRYGGHCKKGSCVYAHSNSEAFCRKCNIWEHPEETCRAK